MPLKEPGADERRWGTKERMTGGERRGREMEGTDNSNRGAEEGKKRWKDWTTGGQRRGGEEGKKRWNERRRRRSAVVSRIRWHAVREPGEQTIKVWSKERL